MSSHDADIASPAGIGSGRRRRQRRQRGRAAASHGDVRPAEVALTLVIIVAPHLMAGVHAWTSAAIAITATVALAITVWCVRDESGLGSDWMVGVLGLMLLVSILHTLPLPPNLIAWLSPDTYNDIAELEGPLGLAPPRWLTFSRAPAETWERVLYTVALLATFTSARLVASVRPSSVLIPAVALSSLGVALSYLIHRALGATSVYGLYTPKLIAAHGPLLNPNNLAGMLALGVPICIALGVRRRAGPRAAWLIAATTIAATGLLAGSRGGLLVLLGGTALFGLFRWRRVTRRDDRAEPVPGSGQGRIRKVLLAALSACVLAGVSYGLASLAAEDFVDLDYTDLTKLELFEFQAQALVSTPTRALAGVGRGAFASAFAAWSPGPKRAMYAEDLPLQYAIEFGIPLAVLFVGALVWRAAYGLRSSSSMQLGAAAGTAALLLQNLSDFSLELAGVAVSVAACLGTIEAPASKYFELSWWSKLALGACVLASLTFAYPASRSDTLASEERLESLLSADDTVFWSSFAQAVRYDSSNPSLSLLASQRKLLVSAPDSLFWFNRTMRLAPAWALPHLQAASWLAGRGYWSQAASELATAGALDPRALQQNLCQWVRVRPSTDFLLQVVPSSGRARQEALEAAAACLYTTDEASSAAIDQLLLKENPDRSSAKLRFAQRARAAGNYAEAIALAREIRLRTPDSAAAAEVEASSLMLWDQPQQAAALLQSLVGHTDDELTLLFTLSRAQAAAGQADAMRHTIDLLRLRAAGSTAQLVRVNEQLSHCESALGNAARAFAAMLEAHRISGAPAHLAAAAELAAGLGQQAFAAKAWNDLCKEHPDVREYCDRRDRAMRTPAF
jgi:tetratricopeptide (TPR) repeat protein